MLRHSPAGLWKANEQMEESALVALQAGLAEFAPAITNAYEGGVQASTLPSRRHSEPDMRAAALFMKRVLVDLRSVWLLLTRGYSSPAASVAASLWEHALAATILSGSKERSDELAQAPAGDLPWSAKRMARLGALALDAEATAGVVQERSRNIYVAYKWLCKIKHPTIRATLHSAGAATTDDGTFVVMSAPDLRPEDLPVKRLILFIACGRTIEAIKAFSRGLTCEPSVPAYQEFNRRLTDADSALLAIARKPSDSLPFGLTADEAQML